jgi:hypothetical protein
MVTTRDIRQHVACTVREVMAVAGQLDRLPEWAQGFASGVERVLVRAPDGESGVEGERWVVDASFGRVEAEFAVDVERGILDHDVTMPDGTVVHNRLRVEPRPHGSELVFTLVRQPGMTDEQWRADAEAVAADLHRLAALCEKIDE